MKKEIFRKTALERLSSPEQLDQVMQVTTPRGWISLSGIALLLVTGAIWSWAGRLTETVAGQGMLVRSGGVLQVVATAAGPLTDLPVAVGDTIKEGQVVAWIDQPELLDQLQDAKNRLAALQEQHEAALGFSERDAALQLQSLGQQRRSLEQSIRADRDRLAALDKRLEAQRELQQRGLVAGSSLLAVQQEYDLTKEKIRASENRLSLIAVEELAAQNRLRETSRAGALKIAEAEEELSQIERRLRFSSQVTSLHNGRVLEILADPGQLVGRGEPILSLDLTGNAIQDLVAVIYVPSIHGKKVKPGMEIHIAPSTVRQEEYGMIIGRVAFASNFPATPRSMERVLKNPQLVQDLSGGDAPYEVHAELLVDPATESQYRWTSSVGPPTRIQTGTVAAGFIVVQTRRPIERVLPVLRHWARG